jgi:aspartate/methionine/tyrosine aminotransferase
MKQHMAQRVQGFGTSIFTEMSALAAEHQAINLSQGFPDFAGPEHVKQAAVAAIIADHNQYPPSIGIMALRQAIATTYQGYGLTVDPADVTITSGATEALCATILALVDHGDEVILFEPAYDAYAPDVIMAGGKPRYVRLHPPRVLALPGSDGSPGLESNATHWTFDPDELWAAFGPKTRAIIVNTPHNPTGKVFTPGELSLIAQLCIEHDVLAITDEVYDRIVFEGSHLPLATLPGMWERTVTINSTGKTFSLTGWKVGYAIAPPTLTNAIRRTHQFITFTTATPFQYAFARALNDAVSSRYYDELLAFYRARRDLLSQTLAEVGFGVVAPAATYFVLVDIRPWGFDDDVTFCRYLMTEAGVAAIPPSVFYAHPETAPPMARFCFAKEIATLQAAAERLQRVQQRHTIQEGRT